MILTALNIATILIGIASLYIAWQSGLKAWRKELSTRRRLQFLDDLNNVLHEYTIKMNLALSRFATVQYILNISKECWDPDNTSDTFWFASFIRADKGSIADMLNSSLTNAEPARVSLEAIVSKGRIYRFKEYQACQGACMMVANVFTRLKGFADGMVNASHSYFENPEVKRIYEKILALSPEELHKQLQDNFSIILAYIETNWHDEISK